MLADLQNYCFAKLKNNKLNESHWSLKNLTKFDIRNFCIKSYDKCTMCVKTLFLYQIGKIVILCKFIARLLIIIQRHWNLFMFWKTDLFFHWWQNLKRKKIKQGECITHYASIPVKLPIASVLIKSNSHKL